MTREQRKLEKLAIQLVAATKETWVKYSQGDSSFENSWTFTLVDDALRVSYNDGYSRSAHMPMVDYNIDSETGKPQPKEEFGTIIDGQVVSTESRVYARIWLDGVMSALASNQPNIIAEPIEETDYKKHLTKLVVKYLRLHPQIAQKSELMFMDNKTHMQFDFGGVYRVRFSRHGQMPLDSLLNELDGANDGDIGLYVRGNRAEDSGVYVYRGSDPEKYYTGAIQCLLEMLPKERK